MGKKKQDEPRLENLLPFANLAESKRATVYYAYVRPIRDSDSIPEEKPKTKLGESRVLTETFFTNWTLHGPSRIVDSIYWHRKVFWAITWLVLIGFGFYKSYDVISEYLGYPKTVSIDIIDVAEMEFPAISFCNLNPVMESLINKTNIENSNDTSDDDDYNNIWESIAEIEVENVDQNPCQIEDDKEGFGASGGYPPGPFGNDYEDEGENNIGNDNSNSEENATNSNNETSNSRNIRSVFDPEYGIDNGERKRRSTDGNIENGKGFTNVDQKDTRKEKKQKSSTRSNRVRRAQNGAKKDEPLDYYDVDHEIYKNKNQTGVRFHCSKFYKVLLYQQLLLGGKRIPTEFQTVEYSECKEQDFRKKESVIIDVVCQIPLINDMYGQYTSRLRDCKSEIKETIENVTQICSTCCPINETIDRKCVSTQEYEDIKKERLQAPKKKLILNAIKRSTAADGSDVTTSFLLTKEDIEKYSLKTSEFIQSCSYDQVRCSERDFYEWISDRFGKCYTFNSVHGTFTIDGKKYKRHAKNASLAGPQNGLKLTLNLVKGAPLSLFSPEVGIRVMVHNPGTLPFPEDEGVNIPPQTTTSVQIGVRQISRVEPPHGKCGNKEIDSKFSYTGVLCNKLCYEKTIREECRCSLGLSPVYDKLSNAESNVTCSYFNMTNKFCIDQVTFRFAHGQIECDCPQLCEEKEYDLRVTSSYTDIDYFKIIQNIKRSSTGSDVCTGNTDSTVRFTVYLEKLSYEYISEQKSYSFETLISNVGGTLGVFVGMSIISMIEFIMYLLDLFYQCATKTEELQDDEIWTPIYLLSENVTEDLVHPPLHEKNGEKMAWSEEKKSSLKSYFSKIFYSE